MKAKVQINVTAYLITEGGQLEPQNLYYENGLYYNRVGIGYRVDPSITTFLTGWFEAYDSPAVGLVHADYPECGPEYWAHIEDVKGVL